MADRSLPPSTVALIAEGAANTRAGRTASAVRIALAFGLALAAAALTVTTITSAQRSADHQILAGRNTIRVLGAANSPVTAASCDALNTAPTVRHAGGLRSAGTTTLANGTEAPRFAVTAGFVSFLNDDHVPRESSVAVGSELAAQSGLRNGTNVQLDAEPLRLVHVLPRSVRTSDWANALLIVEPLTGHVDECWVEFEAAPTDADDRLLTLVDGPRPLVTGPLEASSIPPTPPESTARTLTPARVGFAAAVPILLLTIAFWWARRGDWALYAILGFPAPKTTLIAATEWTLTCGLPAFAGAAWGTLLTLSPDSPHAAIVGAARASAVLMLTASLSLGWLRIFTARMKTRRLLAGI